MQEENPMEEDRENVADIKAKVQHGEYEVDPTAVADALLRHLRELATAQAQRFGSADDAVDRAADSEPVLVSGQGFACVREHDSGRPVGDLADPGQPRPGECAASRRSIVCRALGGAQTSSS